MKPLHRNLPPVADSFFALPARRSPGSRLIFPAVAALASWLVSSEAQASSGTWTGTTGSWATTGNWTGGVVAGATGTITNADTATFSNTATSVTTVDTGRNIGNITFSNTAFSNTLSSALILSSGGEIQIAAGASTSTAGQVVNSALTLEGNYTFANGSTSTNKTLSFGGAISTAATSGTTTLTLDGVNIAANNLTGVISDNGSGVMALTKIGIGTWFLKNATENYSGATTINSGVLDLAGSTTLTHSSVSASGGELEIDEAGGSFTRTASLTLSGGALSLKAVSQTSASNDTIITMNLNPGGYIAPTNNSGAFGADTILVTPTALYNQLLTIGNLVVNPGAALFITSGTATGTTPIGANSIASATAGTPNIQISQINGAATSASLVGGAGALGTTTTSILPFIVGGTTAGSQPTDFVTYDANNGIELLTSYTTTFTGSGTTSNLKSAASDSITADTTINSFAINATGTWDLKGHKLTLTSGALMFDGNGASNLGVTAGSTLNLGGAAGYIYTPNAKSNTISAAIQGATSLTITNSYVNGPGTLILDNPSNSWTGGTFVNAVATVPFTFQIGNGTLAGSVGTGAITINNTTLSLAQTSTAYTLSNAIGGNGSVLVSNLGNTAQAITFTGSNTYTGTTNIQNGSLTASTLNSVSGGVAGSSLGAPVTVANGTIGLGNSNGTGSAKLVDNGTGETTDRAISLVGNGVLDASGASGNIMFTGGVGGVITVAARKSLTLQGSTSATGEISGVIADSTATTTTSTTLVNTSGSTTLNVVNASELFDVGVGITGTGIAAGTTVTAITGNNQVTLSAAATVSNGTVITATGTASPTGVVKAGTGTWTLSGANTYSHGTSVNGGTLYANGGVAGTSSATGAGAVSVASGATLGGSGVIRPTTSSAGITLASGSSLISGGVQAAVSSTTIAGTGLTLDNQVAAGTILDASAGTSNLTFYLSYGATAGTPFDYAHPSTASSYMTVLGTTNSELKFASGDTITVTDLTAGNLVLASKTPYLLIQADGGGSLADNNLYAGLTTSGGGSAATNNLQNGWVTDLTLLGTAADPSVYYGARLYLYNGDLEVVPEPGTWAMLLGGFALLIMIQRRRRA